jgi:ABC-type antimicrobial peptide transport system permease subunit
MTEVTIPSTVEYNGQTYTVDRISSYAFYGCQSLTTVTMPNTIKSIGYEAFRECFALNSTTMSDQLTYIGDLYDHPTGIILTDYMADSIIYTTGKYLTHESMLGQNSFSYINAIIDTGYKERHKETIESYIDLIVNGASDQEKNALFSSEGYANLRDEIEQYLGINYSLNPNFATEIKAVDMKAHYSLRNTIFIANGQSSEKINYTTLYNDDEISSKLSVGEMLMGYSQYNSLFGTQYTLNDLDTFVSHSIKIECYNGENVYYSKEFTLVGLRKYDGVYVKYDDYNEYAKSTMFKTGIYFDNPSLTDKLYDVAIDNAFQPVSIYYDSIYEINKGISVVRTLFVFIGVVLLVACLLFLISYSVTSVRKKRVEIGILRGLGMTNKDLYDVYICQFLKIGLIISVVLTIGLIISSQFANILLQEGFASLMKLTFIKSIKIVKFDIEVLLIDIGILFAILVVSLIFPIIKLRKIKPLNIIKS